MTAKEHFSLNMDFLAHKFGSCDHSQCRKNKSVLYLFREYLKAILNWPQGDKKIPVRTNAVSQNHLEGTSAQAEACTENTVGYSA